MWQQKKVYGIKLYYLNLRLNFWKNKNEHTSTMSEKYLYF